MNKDKQPTNKNQQTGLNSEQLAKAVELYNKVTDRAIASTEIDNEKKSYLKTSTYLGRTHKPSAIVSVGYDMEHGVKKARVFTANRAAKRHFKKHEGAYQEQALKEATAAGVAIKGWDQAEANQSNEKPKPLVGNLEFDLVGAVGGKRSRAIEIPLVGELEEAQDTAYDLVFMTEIRAPLDVVQNARVTFADGSEQSWEEFTQPAVERLNSERPAQQDTIS